jgi:hypothetical protein
MTLKQVIQKLVPYSSAVYAEHIFRTMKISGTQKALSEPEGDSGDHIQILIEAAGKLRDLVKEMESAGDLSGYIIYKEESEEDRKKKEAEDAKFKELINAENGGEAVKEEIPEEESDDEILNAQTAAIVKKFKGKLLMEFVPHFLLS